MLADSPVERIVFEGRHAVAVRYRGRGGPVTLRARREIVVSAGAFGSLQLLRPSGIGPGEARAGGARSLVHADGGCAAAGKVGPTVVLDAPQGCTLMRGEICGPVPPVVGYDGIEEALAFVAGHARPLAL